MAEDDTFKPYTVPDETAPVTAEDVQTMIASQMSNQNVGQMKLTAGYFQSANFKTGVQGWQLTPAGNLEANAGTFRGSLVANSIDIPNTTTANSFHIDNTGNTWWGATTLGAAIASITKAGAITGSSVTITGGTVGGSTTVGIANVNLASRGWTQTSIFSVTDSDTIAWASGTFTSADGTAYSISSGNTGNMAAATYIYLDIAVSTTAYQTTTTASTAVGAGKVLVAKAQNGTNEATFQVFGGIGGQNIDASSIVANSITANELSTALVYAGSIQIDTSGNIRSGQTAFNTGTGWFIGDSGGTAKMSIGSSSNYVTWDGTYLRIKGSLDVGSTGIINNASYTVANLPVPATSVGFNPPSANDPGKGLQTDPLTTGWTFTSLQGTDFTDSGTVSGKRRITFTSPSAVNDAAKIEKTVTGLTNGSSPFSVTFLQTGSEVNVVASLYVDDVLIAGPTQLTSGAASTLSGSATIAGGQAKIAMKVLQGDITGGGLSTTFDIYSLYIGSDFTNPGNAYASDNTYATATATSGALTVELSKDAGVNYQNALSQTFTGADSLLTYGNGSTELWGSSWTRADMVDANFRLRISEGPYSQVYKTFGFATGSDILTGIEVAIEANYAASTISVDLIKVKIYYGSSTLPIQAGSMAFASNGRKNGEGAGSGTGVLSYYDGTAWRATDTGATVAA